MTPVYFKLTTQQFYELKQLMNQEGYKNKTEFFRFLIKFYKYNKYFIENDAHQRQKQALEKTLKKYDLEDG